MLKLNGSDKTAILSMVYVFVVIIVTVVVVDGGGSGKKRTDREEWSVVHCRTGLEGGLPRGNNTAKSSAAAGHSHSWPIF